MRTPSPWRCTRIASRARTVDAYSAGVVNGNALQHFSTTVDGLTAATAYRYRVGLDVSRLWTRFQAAWLGGILSASPSKWNVVTFHQPVYSTSAGRNETVLPEESVPVFERKKAAGATTDKEVGEVYDQFTVTKYDVGEQWVTEAGMTPPAQKAPSVPLDTSSVARRPPTPRARSRRP